MITQANKGARLNSKKSSGARNHHRHHEIAVPQILLVNCYNFCASRKPSVIKVFTSNFTVNICGSLERTMIEIVGHDRTSIKPETRVPLECVFQRKIAVSFEFEFYLNFTDINFMFFEDWKSVESFISGPCWTLKQ